MTTVECPTCGGEGEIEPDGTGWSTPPGSGEAASDGETYRLEWHPRRGVTKRALFRVVTDDRVSVLQHVRTIHTRRGGAASGCHLNPDAELADVPRPLLATMKADGYRPADSAEVVA
jgi:hypothetical protein